MQLFQLIGKKAVRINPTCKNDDSFWGNEYITIDKIDDVAVYYTDTNNYSSEFFYDGNLSFFDDNWEEYKPNTLILMLEDVCTVKVEVMPSNLGDRVWIDNTVLTYSDALELAKFINKHCKE